VTVTAKSKYIELLKKLLIDYENIGAHELYPLSIVEPNWKTFPLHFADKLLKPFNFRISKSKMITEENRLNGYDWPANAKTMIGMGRLNNIEMCVRDILERNIEGDLIETGVWRGGATMLMKALLDESNIIDRKVWLADSFRGLPKGDEDKYAADKGNNLYRYRILSASVEEVKNNFRKYDLLDNNVIFLEGWFRDTLPAAPIKKLALLRLDGDLYESTILALENLYPKLSPGGYVIIDDFNAFPYCRQAVMDYREKQKINDKIIEIDKQAAYWKKLQ
jgi:hypothetical protein